MTLKMHSFTQQTCFWIEDRDGLVLYPEDPRRLRPFLVPRELKSGRNTEEKTQQAPVAHGMAVTAGRSLNARPSSQDLTGGKAEPLKYLAQSGSQMRLQGKARLEGRPQVGQQQGRLEKEGGSKV